MINVQEDSRNQLIESGLNVGFVQMFCEEMWADICVKIWVISTLFMLTLKYMKLVQIG